MFEDSISLSSFNSFGSPISTTDLQSITSSNNFSVNYSSYGTGLWLTGGSPGSFSSSVQSGEPVMSTPQPPVEMPLSLKPLDLSSILTPDLVKTGSAGVLGLAGPLVGVPAGALGVGTWLFLDLAMKAGQSNPGGGTWDSFTGGTGVFPGP